MEDDDVIKYPYYETTYLDDNNTKHITYLKNKEDIAFYNDRFCVVDCNYVSD